MGIPAAISVTDADETSTVTLTGDWSVRTLNTAPERLQAVLRGSHAMTIDLTGVGRFDTAGAYAVLTAAGGTRIPGPVRAGASTRRSLQRVADVLQRRAAETDRRSRPLRSLAAIGHYATELGLEIYRGLVFLGLLLRAIVRAVINPSRLRLAPLSALSARAGLSAAAIVGVTAFFIGIVIALIGANLLSDFGAQVFTVELVGVTVFREFNILITAILLAGRSASSFTAELGAMKMNQEVDAMTVLGVDPYEALVLPRFLALLLTVPLLAFIATLAGLAGGLLASWIAIDVSPALFVDRVLNNVSPRHFWVGMAKAPVMAAVIAAIGCRQGLSVGLDVEALGRRVTTSVVHAIFAIIVIDAAAALLFIELDI